MCTNTDDKCCTRDAVLYPVVERSKNFPTFVLVLALCEGLDRAIVFGFVDWRQHHLNSIFTVYICTF